MTHFFSENRIKFTILLLFSLTTGSHLLAANGSLPNQHTPKEEKNVISRQEQTDEILERLNKLDENDKKQEQQLKKLKEESTKLLQQSKRINEGVKRLKEEIVKTNQENDKLKRRTKHKKTENATHKIIKNTKYRLPQSSKYSQFKESRARTLATIPISPTKPLLDDATNDLVQKDADDLSTSSFGTKVKFSDAVFGIIIGAIILYIVYKRKNTKATPQEFMNPPLLALPRIGRGAAQENSEGIGTQQQKAFSTSQANKTHWLLIGIFLLLMLLLGTFLIRKKQTETTRRKK